LSSGATCSAWPADNGGDSCPLLPGKHYEDWELDDPEGKTLDEIRPIRGEIRDRVANLIEKLASNR
jgi:arsenate reductase